jgi:hypothetical protein
MPERRPIAALIARQGIRGPCQAIDVSRLYSHDYKRLALVPRRALAHERVKPCLELAWKWQKKLETFGGFWRLWTLTFAA